jgi:hypothetical protein
MRFQARAFGAPRNDGPILLSAECALLPAAILPLLVLDIVALDDGHGVGARQPAVQIDVGAAARAERTKRALGRLAADRARLGLGRRVGHDGNIGVMRCRRTRASACVRTVFRYPSPAKLAGEG